MKKSTKKGFTIVELVVVIAIIAILAAVLIPTFAGLIKKANQSADKQLVRNLNTALLADAAINGKHATMHDALEAVKKSGFDVARINETKASDNEILWDSKNDLFCYFVKDGGIEYLPENDRKYTHNEGSTYDPTKVNDVDYWVIVSDVNKKSDTYSNYLFNVEAVSLPVTTGVDVGEGSTVGAITYDRHNATKGQEVVIRTNSVTTDLTIDAAKDTVRHFDFVGKVHVVSVDPVNCYEENGKAAFTQIDSGKYKTTETADVELLFVSDSSAVSLQLAAGTVDHAHAISEAAASAINATNPGITFDYDGNSDQDSLDVYHHVDAQDQLGFTTEFSSNASSDVVAEAIDKKAGEEVAEDPKISTYAARIGTTLYSTFDAAYTSAVSGNKIVLLNNVLLGDIIEGNYMQEDYTSGFNFTKAGITLDLNGKSLVSNVNVGFAFDVISGDLTIKDSVGTGMIRATRAPVVVHCGSSATVNMYGGTILAEYADPNVYNTAALDVDGTANIYGGTLSSQTDWEFEYEGNTYYVFSFSLNNRNITHIYGGTFISKHKDEGGNGIANCRDLYIHDDITTQGLYWTNDNDKKTTKIEVADGKKLTIDGAYDCKRVAGGKDLALTGTGNLIYDSDLFIEEEVE